MNSNAEISNSCVAQAKLVTGLMTLLGCVLSSVGCAPLGDSDHAENSSKAAAQTLTGPIEAVAGVGKKGQKTSEDEGVTKILTGPVSALEHVKQFSVLQIQVKQLIDVHRATTGKYPTNNEFMKSVTDNRIKLPELAEGQAYYFDQQAGKLMVYPEGQLPAE